MSDQAGIRCKRLLYQAQHRGFKEADLLIGGFAAAHLSEMSDRELDEFEVLLGYPDHDLFSWLKGGARVPETVVGPVFELLRDFDISKTFDL